MTAAEGEGGGPPTEKQAGSTRRRNKAGIRSNAVTFKTIAANPGAATARHLVRDGGRSARPELSTVQYLARTGCCTIPDLLMGGARGRNKRAGPRQPWATIGSAFIGAILFLLAQQMERDMVAHQRTVLADITTVWISETDAQWRPGAADFRVVGKRLARAAERAKREYESVGDRVEGPSRRCFGGGSTTAAKGGPFRCGQVCQAATRTRNDLGFGKSAGCEAVAVF